MKTFILFILVGASIQITTPYGSYLSNDSGKELPIYFSPDRTPAARQVESPKPETKPLPYNPQDYWQQPSSTQEYWGR